MARLSPLLSLPPELLTEILSYLDIPGILIVARVHPALLAVVSSPSLHPFRLVFATALAGKSDLSELSRLGCYSFVPRSAWVDVLVRAPAKFIVEEFEVPVGLGETLWEEAVRRRFLPGWTGSDWRREGQTWRSIFFKTIYRVNHRSWTTCTSEEAYTRWITLDRRGTATINRIRAQNYSPLDVFQSVKQQNNLHAYPTTVRLLCSLADADIFVLGVLHHPNSLFLNPNAHKLLHPPAEWPDVIERYKARPRERTMSEGAGGGGGGSNRDSESSWWKRKKAISPTATQSVGAVASSAGGNQEPVGFAPASGVGTGGGLGLPLSRTLSGGSQTGGSSKSVATVTASLVGLLRPRSHPRTSAFSMGTSSSHASRPLISSTSTLSAGGLPLLNPFSPNPSAELPLTAAPAAASVSFANGTIKDSSRPPEHARRASSGATSSSRPFNSDRPHRPDGRMPYHVMHHPTPLPSHRLYPNYTPGGGDTRRRPSGRLVGDVSAPSDSDSWLVDEEPEWPEVEGSAHFVGPVMIIAALRSPWPTTSAAAEPSPDGTHLIFKAAAFASFGWEDLWAVAPWLKEELAGKTGGGIGYLREGE